MGVEVVPSCEPVDPVTTVEQLGQSMTRTGGCMMCRMGSPRQESDSLDVQVLIDSIPALIHTARPDGYLDYFNKRWLEYLGVTLDKVAGWNWTAFVHPEDVEGIVAKWRACVATGEIFEYETRVRGANGEYRWMFHRKVPLRDANGNIVKWYGSSLDIEDRKTTEGKIREQETELRQILDLTPQIVAVFGPGGERLYANRVTLDYFGLSLEEWLQTPGVIFSPSRFIHPDDRERVARGYSDSIRSGGSAFEMEMRVQRADGSFRWLLARYNPLHDDKGQVKRWYVASTDIDERKRAEDTLRHENVRLEERTRIARELHDTLLQSFMGALLQLGAATNSLPPDSQVKSRLDVILQFMGLEEGRNAIQGLRSSGSRPLELVAALSAVHEEFLGQEILNELQSGFAVRC